jgi:hypothetical protein
MAGKTVPFGQNPRRPDPKDLDAFVHGSKAEPSAPSEPPLSAVAAPAAPAPVAVEEAPKPPLEPKVPMKRLTFDIPATTHRRMKIDCVEKDVDMAEELRKMIEARWPATP